MQYNPIVSRESMDHIIPLKQVIHDWNTGHYDHEEAGDYSATDLINPPRIVQLRKRHRDDLKLSIASQINAFFGTAVHDIYEKTLGKLKEYTVEQRIKTTINDRIITGKFDILLNNKHIYDIKTTKTWKKVFDPTLKEWHEQQNIYAYLLATTGITVESLNIIAHYYDWVENMALRNKEYPSDSVVEYSLTLWKPADIYDFISERLELHKNSEALSDDDLPACSREDRWERFDDGSTMQFALFRNKEAKRATKLFTNLEEAIATGRVTKNHGSDSFVEIRYAQRKRCQKYCDVSHHCNHFQEYLQQVNTGTLNDYVPLYN